MKGIKKPKLFLIHFFLALLRVPIRLHDDHTTIMSLRKVIFSHGQAIPNRVIVFRFPGQFLVVCHLQSPSKCQYSRCVIAEFDLFIQNKSRSFIINELGIMRQGLSLVQRTRWNRVPTSPSNRYAVVQSLQTRHVLILATEDCFQYSLTNPITCL